MEFGALKIPAIPAREIVLGEVLGAGEGNQGEVWRGLWRGQDVAVKRLTDGAEAGANERAAKEVQRLAQAAMNNAHVCRVLGTSIIDGALHLVMPLAERGSLARRVRELGTGLPVGELVDVAEQMLEGLAHLHRAGLVHCDVKPHNLLLDRRGTVLLGDFGLAKISQERASMGRHSRVTLRQEAWGTFGYMSPEQYDAKKEITPLSDAYSAAATLSHLATGQEPFAGQRMAQVVFAVCVDGAKPAIPEFVPEPLRSAALRALEKDPARRASVADMLAAAKECRRVLEAADTTRGEVECGTCMGPVPRKRAVGCNGGSGVHYLCDEHLAGMLAAHADNPAGWFKRHLGNVPCAELGHACGGTFASAGIVALLEDADARQFMSNVAAGARAREAEELAAEVERLRGELARARAGSREERIVRHKLAVAEAVTPKCGRCGRAFVERESEGECLALKCSDRQGCGAEICGWCFGVFPHAEVHGHVRGCARSLRPGNVFASIELFEQGKRRWAQERVAEYLVREVAEGERRAVWEALRADPLLGEWVGDAPAVPVRGEQPRAGAEEERHVAADAQVGRVLSRVSLALGNRLVVVALAVVPLLLAWALASRTGYLSVATIQPVVAAWNTYVGCGKGYTLADGKCVDVDECKLGLDQCGPLGTCQNLPGSFTCVCPAGYKPSRGTCVDIDECREQPGICGAGDVTCVNKQGGYECRCREGFRHAQGRCVDVNECLDPQACGPAGVCRNTPGSYTCTCDPKQCGALGECQRQGEKGYTCKCKAGYAFDGEQCVDIDECADGSHACGDGGTCSNTAGSYTCKCMAGYRLGQSWGQASCLDVDECREQSDICGDGDCCVNTRGGYECRRCSWLWRGLLQMGWMFPVVAVVAVGAVAAGVATWSMVMKGLVPRTLSGHSYWVKSVAFSPDGRWVASGSSDKTVKLWDAATGEVVRTLSGHSGWVNSVAFSPDGRWVASGSDDETVKLWNAATGEVVRTLSGHSYGVRSVAFSPDGRWVASGSGDKTVKLWDAATGEVVRTLSGHSGWVNSVAFSPDGRWVASGSDDETVKLWNAATGEVVRTLSGHSGWVRSVAFSPDGRWVASGSDDETVKLWNAATGEVVRTLSGHSYGVNSVAFSPDGRWVASGSDDETVKLWRC